MFRNRDRAVRIFVIFVVLTVALGLLAPLLSRG